MPRKKSNLSRKTKNAKRAAEHRAAETPKQKRIRLVQKSKREAECRAAESSEHRATRLAQKRKAAKDSRAAETPAERNTRLAAMRQYSSDLRASGIRPSKKPRAPRKATKRAKKDPLAPKKAQSAYMIWFQANRKDLAKPGEAGTEVAKRAGATWKGMTDHDKQEWMGRAKKDKERYEKEMKVWKAGGAGASTSAPRASSGGSPTKAKSKEYVASDHSSSDDSKPLAKKGKNKSNGEESTESTPQSDSD